MDPSIGDDLIRLDWYRDHGPPHPLWTKLRAESPVHYCVPEDILPFWAITRHADICEVSKQPETYRNSPGITLIPSDRLPSDRERGLGAMRSVIDMDPPEHRTYRKVGSPWFTPNAVRSVDAVVAESARSLVDRLAGKTGEGECDFATEVAVAHPLRILSTILGVPREQEPEILRLTNLMFATGDEELRGEDEGTALELLEKAGLEFYALFAKIIEDRRSNPTGDLASVLATGRVNGELMGPMETFGYYLIIFTAGHDTTKNAIAGGMHALIEHPEELEKLRRNPELTKLAVEEIVRWTSPVNYMKRTATRDVEFRGQRIREGEDLVLFYASANRDGAVFDDPFEFRIDRRPNPHLGFGIGEHFCLGANLARRSQQALLRELASRLEWVELAGEPERIRANFVVGLKHLPIRYRIAPRA